MEQKTYHHALHIRHDVCTGCSHCMKVCPTEALRIREGKAFLFPNLCVDCGECLRICPVRAIKVEDDDFQRIFDYEHRVLILPSIFVGQFGAHISEELIINALFSLGFTAVHAAEDTVDYLLDVMNHYIEENERPVISSFCPAVVRIIQVRFPALASHVMRLKQPMELTAHHLKNSYVNKHQADPSSVGIFYVTPCAAKIASVKSPVGNYFSPIDGVINMDYLYNRVQQVINKPGVVPAVANENSASEKSLLSGRGLKYSLTGGEKDNMWQNCLAVDGLHNVMDILEHLENDEIEGVDYLELRVCDESCAGGILSPGNRFFAAERLRRMAKHLPEEQWVPEKDKQFLSGVVTTGAVTPRPIVKYHHDVKRAIAMMEEARKLKDSLPGIDCGACGSPGCEALANDVVCGRAMVDACVFMQVKHEKDGTLPMKEAIHIMEETWGTERFK